MVYVIFSCYNIRSVWISKFTYALPQHPKSWNKGIEIFSHFIYERRGIMAQKDFSPSERLIVA